MIKQLNILDFKDKIFNYDYNTTWIYKNNKPSIIYFKSDWCLICDELEFILNNLYKEHYNGIDIYTISVDISHEITKVFDIRTIPTMLIIPMNENPSLITGLQTNLTMKNIIEDLILMESDYENR